VALSQDVQDLASVLLALAEVCTQGLINQREHGAETMNKRFKLILVLSIALVAVASVCRLSFVKAVHGNSLVAREDSFAVEFSNCVESIGVTLVQTEQARALIPNEFHLVGDGTPLTPLVVRTARCDIDLAGRKTSGGEIAQIGLVIVPPDFTGDINNYTLWYYTTDAELANHLVRLGVSAQHVQNIAYGYQSGPAQIPVPFSVNIPRPGDPMFSLNGNVTRSETPSGSFLANWWQKGRRGIVKMNTNVPSIFIGNADLTLKTEADNELGELISGGSIGFQILQQFNTFDNAHMAVSVGAP
jgi:hypothetical protein